MLIDPSNIQRLEINDDSNLDGFEEFDGWSTLDLDILLPKTYFHAIDGLSERIGMNKVMD